MSCNSSPRPPKSDSLFAETPMFGHQKKSTAVIPRSIQRSARFRVSGVRDSRCQKPHANTNSEFPNPDIYFGFSAFTSCDVIQLCSTNPEIPIDFPIGIFPELLDFCHASSYDGRSSIISRFHEIKCSGCLASSGFLKRRIPICRWTLPFRDESLDFCHVSLQDGWSTSISRFREIKCQNVLASCPFDPRSSETLKCRWLDLRHVSQPMDDSDLFRGFHHGDSRSPVLRTFDIPISEVPISRRLSGLSLCLRGFKPRATPVRSHD
jgi:hypothetical protein